MATAVDSRPRLEPLHVGEKAVATLRNGLDEAGSTRGIPEGATKLGDGGVQAGVEFDERVVRPQELPQLLARDQFARPATRRTRMRAGCS